MSIRVVLAMHGAPPNDFPKREMGEFFGLRSRLGHGADSEALRRHDELEAKMRQWPRTAQNDPYYTASQALALRLAEATGHDVTVGFNEFCAPTMEEALMAPRNRGQARWSWSPR